MPRSFPALNVDVQSVSAAALKQRLDGGEAVTILDTRRPEDIAEWTISHPNARVVNVPFTAFLDGEAPAKAVPAEVPDGPLVTCCAKGLSSEYVAEFLAKHGHEVAALDDGMEGWARLYERAVLFEDADATLYQYHRPSSGCLAYCLVSGESAAVIDPLRAFTDRYREDIETAGARLEYVIDTHVHADHISGLRALADQTGATLVVPDGAIDRGFEYADVSTVGDGDTLQVGTQSLEAVALPGHTSEHTGFAVEAVLLTADALFLDGVGRPDLERGTEGASAAAEQLYETIHRIGEYPGETVIAPGHVSPETRPPADGTYAATLEVLQQRIAAFDRDRESFVEQVSTGLPARPNNYERIIAANLGGEQLDDETAFELELGPNNCAVATPGD